MQPEPIGEIWIEFAEPGSALIIAIDAASRGGFRVELDRQVQVSVDGATATSESLRVVTRSMEPVVEAPDGLRPARTLVDAFGFVDRDGGEPLAVTVLVGPRGSLSERLRPD